MDTMILWLCRYMVMLVQVDILPVGIIQNPCQSSKSLSWELIILMPTMVPFPKMGHFFIQHKHACLGFVHPCF